MTRRKYAAGLGAIACLLSSTAAFAADATRSSAALPAVQPAVQAPTQGVRASTTLKKKSNAVSQGVAIGIGILAVGAVVAGVAVATNSDDEPDSPG